MMRPKRASFFLALSPRRASLSPLRYDVAGKAEPPSEHFQHLRVTRATRTSPCLYRQGIFNGTQLLTMPTDACYTARALATMSPQAIELPRAIHIIDEITTTRATPQKRLSRRAQEKIFAAGSPTTLLPPTCHFSERITPERGAALALLTTITVILSYLYA